jgi:cardiolipin synthase
MPLALTLCALFAGCAGVPKVNDAPSPQGNAIIIGIRGPLTARQSKPLLAPEPGNAGILRRHLAIEEAVADAPLPAGNATRLLINRPQTFAAMFAAVRDAEASVSLEYTSSKTLSQYVGPQC